MRIIQGISVLIYLLAFFSKGYSQNIFPYESEIENKDDFIYEDIDFFNMEADIQLSGTLIKPKQAFEKIAVIVPGSGKDTRYAHFVLTEELLKAGIAVYRFDERGVGRSEGEYSELVETLSWDISAATDKIKQLYTDKKIGFIGHSLGGVASLLSFKNHTSPEFLILIETPVIKNGDFVIHQIRMDYENSIPEVMRQGKSKTEVLTFLEGYKQVLTESDKTSFKKDLKNYIKASGFQKKFIRLAKDDLFVEMSKIDLEATLKEANIPILYLTGTKDNIIDNEKEVNLIYSFENENIEVHIYEGLNHYLTDRNGKVGSSLYQMDEEPLSLIIDWLSE
ncbi:alpha/beta fold hydrolase [Penaeicola halotolerans]|uniref:alpha/beta fold hydrolase n=1 Tax=Penaeicola halotolerans TaxID=2793196 RepID=UPI001CF82250|nr:alpha/beta fold hydrolase [Penaeicola halotolerans]